MTQARDEAGEQDRAARLGGPARGAAGELGRERHQPERGDRCEQRPDDQEQAGAGVTPGQSEPAIAAIA